MPDGRCGNCGAALSGEYCSACGQRQARRSARFNYAELLVFDAYCLGHGGLIGVLVGAVLSPASPSGLSLNLGLPAAYVAWCLRGFQGIGWAAAVGRAPLLVVGYVLIFNLIALLIVNALALAGLL